jgi:hypothetical protein
MIKVYYAHCMALYDTSQEARDMRLLEHLGFAVINPNNPSINVACEQRRSQLERLRDDVRPDESLAISNIGGIIMEEFFRPMVRSCDALAFRALPDGRIPAGVTREIDWAQQDHKMVFELPSNLLSRRMSVEATREYLREIGQR